MTVSVMFLTTATHFSAVYWVAATRVQLDLKHEKTDRRTAQKKKTLKNQMLAKRLLLHVNSPSEL